jgi:hypothetical protein
MFLTRELVFPTTITSANTTSVVRIPPLPFMVCSEKSKKFNELKFKW